MTKIRIMTTVTVITALTLLTQSHSHRFYTNPKPIAFELPLDFTDAESVTTHALSTVTSNVEIATAYAFYTSDERRLFVVMYNKDKSSTDMTVNLKGNTFSTNGEIELYGIDESKGLSYIGTVNNKPSSSSFTVSMPQWTVRMAILK
ncbi:MAG: hypothetical protein GY928_29310 [Colwellia sp.]|nr:hypothetical protein [Colwellia sp.]